jgi:hypothetical protein
VKFAASLEYLDIDVSLIINVYSINLIRGYGKTVLQVGKILEIGPNSVL